MLLHRASFGGTRTIRCPTDRSIRFHRYSSHFLRPITSVFIALTTRLANLGKVYACPSKHFFTSFSLRCLLRYSEHGPVQQKLITNRVGGVLYRWQNLFLPHLHPLLIHFGAPTNHAQLLWNESIYLLQSASTNEEFFFSPFSQVLPGDTAVLLLLLPLCSLDGLSNYQTSLAASAGKHRFVGFAAAEYVSYTN